MDSETSVKNLEAQNAQVQIAILELAKGQQELKSLIIKKKKKSKGSVGLSHLTRKVKIPVKRSKKAPIPEIIGEVIKETITATRVLPNPLFLLTKKITIPKTNRVITNTSRWKNA